MTQRQHNIIALIASVGQEMTEDSMVMMGWANSYAQARAQIAKAQKAQAQALIARR